MRAGGERGLFVYARGFPAAEVRRAVGKYLRRVAKAVMREFKCYKSTSSNSYLLHWCLEELELSCNTQECRYKPVQSMELVTLLTDFAASVKKKKKKTD